MRKTHKNVTVFKLTDQTRRLLQLMHFATPPEEAEYLAFFEDGEAQWMLDFEGSLGLPDELFVVGAHTNLTVG